MPTALELEAAEALSASARALAEMTDRVVDLEHDCEELTHANTRLLERAEAAEASLAAARATPSMEYAVGYADTLLEIIEDGGYDPAKDLHMVKTARAHLAECALSPQAEPAIRWRLLTDPPAKQGYYLGLVEEEEDGHRSVQLVLYAPDYIGAEDELVWTVHTRAAYLKPMCWMDRAPLVALRTPEGKES